MKTNILTKKEAQNIVDFIAKIESKSSTEIKIIIAKKKGFFQKNKPVMDLALKEFYKNNLHKTRDRTGILIYIILKDREIAIIGDEGIHQKVGEKYWDNLVRKTITHFKLDNFYNGILETLKELEVPLSEHFPIKEDDTNEISNDLIIK